MEKIQKDVFQQYSEGRITIGRLAKILRRDLRATMFLVAKEVPIQYSLKDLHEDFAS